MSKTSKKLAVNPQHELWEEDDHDHIATVSKSKSNLSRNSLNVIIAYQFIYLSGIAFSLYNFFLLSQNWKRNLELSESPSIFGRYKDQNDLEWKIFVKILIDNIPYLFLHLIIAQVIRCYNPKLLRLFYIIFGTIMSLKILGPFGTGICYLVPAVMFLVLFSRQKFLIWLTWCILLVTFNCKFFQNFLESNMHGEGEYTTSVTVAWILLRCVSFCLITCDEDPQRLRQSLPQLLDIFSYCLYFPNYITGPFVHYKDFDDGINKAFQPWTLRRLAEFLFQILRFATWIGLGETLLYFFYAHALIYHPNYMENFNAWTMAGYYIFALIFFFLKYVVFYGLPSVFARVEGYNTPDPPKCVLLVRRYSDIWRYFDSGLHRFIIDHIYLPFLGEEASFFKEIQGSVVAFTFIYVWHGAYPSVLWWCVFNYVLTMVEKVGDRFSKTTFYNDWENKYLPGKFGKAFRFFVTGSVLSISMNSLFIFITSVEHAKYLFNNVFIKGFPSTTFVTIFFFALMGEGGNDFLHLRKWRKGKKI